MESKDNYGLIIRHLRTRAGLSVRNFAKKCGRSAGWLSEFENGVGSARVDEKEFNRLVAMLGGSREREMFRTWVANHKNAERVDRTFDGAVLKFLRVKRDVKIEDAAKRIGLSTGYLSKLENGRKQVTFEMRKRIMAAYSYSPSSFKNFSSDPVRARAVPLAYKLEILLKNLPDEKIGEIFLYARSLLGPLDSQLSPKEGE